MIGCNLIVRSTLYKAVWACNASVDSFLFQIIDAVAWSFLSCLKLRRLEYCKVPSSRPGYYSMLYLFGQRSQYISIKFPLHKQSENPRVGYTAIPYREITGFLQGFPCE